MFSVLHQKEDLRNVKKAVEKGAKVFYKGIREAAKLDHREILFYLLDKFYDDGGSLYGAAEGNNVDLIEILLERYKYNLYYGLQGATRGGHIELINFFLEKLGEDGLDETWADECLYEAAKGGHLHLVKYFLQEGATDLNLGLQAAVEGGDLNIVKFFVKEGADDFLRGLESSASKGNLKLARYFLARGAKPTQNIFKLACGSGNLELVELLFSRLYVVNTRIDENEKIGGLNNGLLEAASSGHLEVVKFLIEQGASNLNKALKKAAQYWKEDIVYFLLENGETDMNAGLIGAARSGNVNLTNLLLTYGADNVQEALEQSIKYGKLDTFKFLAVRDVDLNNVNIEIIENDNIYMFKFGEKLLKFDLNVALKIAAENGSLDILDYLVEKGATNIKEAAIESVKDQQGKVIAHLLKKKYLTSEDLIPYIMEKIVNL